MQALTRPATKRCTKCGVNKPMSEYNRDRRAKDGRRSQCRTCNAEADRTRRRAKLSAGLCAQCSEPRVSDWFCQRHLAEHRARSRAWQKANPEYRAEYSRAWYKANRERHAENGRAWAEANVAAGLCSKCSEPRVSERLCQRHLDEQRARSRTWYAANREYFRTWREANIAAGLCEKCSEPRVSERLCERHLADARARTRARRVKRLMPTWVDRDLYRCTYCSADLDDGLDVEHQIPRDFIETDEDAAFIDSPANLAPACPECNRGPGGKFSMTPAQWFDSMADDDPRKVDVQALIDSGVFTLVNVETGEVLSTPKNDRSTD